MVTAEGGAAIEAIFVVFDAGVFARGVDAEAVLADEPRRAAVV